MAASSPRLSVVVVAYDMARELPRTLRSLLPPYQRGVAASEYEVIVVDNGSPEPLVPPDGIELRWERRPPGDPSPAAAANHGIGLASGEFIGLIIDGARMASPRLLHFALRAVDVAARPVVTAPAFRIDGDLSSTDWERDGYELFTIGSPAGSSSRGLFGAMGESSSLFMPRSLWDEVGGLDERFTLPGGGLVNHDLYNRACALGGAQLVVLLGEATFHQPHGGAATSGKVTRDEMWADYQSVTGRPHRPPRNEPVYFGHVPAQIIGYIRESAALARSRQPPT